MLLSLSLQIWEALMYSFVWTTVGVFIIWIILLIFSSINKNWKIKNLTKKQSKYLQYVKNERKDRYLKLNWAFFISLIFGFFL